MKKMNKTTAIVLIVILLIGGFYLFNKPVTSPEVEVPIETPNLEEDSSQVIETPDPAPAPAPVPPNPAAVLDGKSFRLTSFNGVIVSEDANYTLSFEDGRIGAKFCNSMGGEYTLSNGFIRASEMVSTLMYCSSPENLMGLETFFNSLLNRGAAYSFVGPNLVLADDKNTMTFTVSVQ